MIESWKKCLFLLLCGFLIFEAESKAITVSADITLNFLKCVVRRTSSSPYFKDKDRKDMAAATDLLTTTRKMLANKGTSSEKILTTAIASSMSNIVATSDFASNRQRREAYMLALQQCSIAVIGTVDSEFIQEAERLLSEAESRQVPNRNNAANVRRPYDIGNVQFTDNQRNFQTYKELQSASEINVPSNLERNIQPSQSIKENSQLAPVRMSHSSSNEPEARMTPDIALIIFNHLINSPSFVSVFHRGIDLPETIALLKEVAATSLIPYNASIIEEVSSAIDGAVTYLLPDSSPREYALAISRAIGSILKFYGFSSADIGSSVGKAIVLNLEAKSEKAVPSNRNVPDSSEHVVSNESKLSYNTQEEGYFLNTQAFTSDSVPTQFRSSLTNLLSQSESLASLFCDELKPQDTAEMSSEMVKSSMSNFGEKIALAVASAVKNVVSKLSKESSCSEYADIISKSITDVLQSNNKLSFANVTDIAEKVFLSLSQFPKTLFQFVEAHSSAEFEKGKSAADETISINGLQKLESSFWNENAQRDQQFRQQWNEQNVHPSVSSTALSNEETVTSTLTNIFNSSDEFSSAFHTNVTREDRESYISAMVQHSLSRYGIDIADDINNALATALNEVDTNSVKSYAEIFSRVLASSLNFHGILGNIIPQVLAATMLSALHEDTFLASEVLADNRRTDKTSIKSSEILKSPVQSIELQEYPTLKPSPFLQSLSHGKQQVTHFGHENLQSERSQNAKHIKVAPILTSHEAMYSGTAFTDSYTASLKSVETPSYISSTVPLPEPTATKTTVSSEEGYIGTATYDFVTAKTVFYPYIKNTGVISSPEFLAETTSMLPSLHDEILLTSEATISENSDNVISTKSPDILNSPVQFAEVQEIPLLTINIEVPATTSENPMETSSGIGVMTTTPVYESYIMSASEFVPEKTYASLTDLTSSEQPFQASSHSFNASKYVMPSYKKSDDANQNERRKHAINSANNNPVLTSDDRSKSTSAAVVDIPSKFHHLSTTVPSVQNNKEENASKSDSFSNDSSVLVQLYPDNIKSSASKSPSEKSFADSEKRLPNNKFLEKSLAEEMLEDKLMDVDFYEFRSEDSLRKLTDQVNAIATSSITLMKSRDFDVQRFCFLLNQLAPLLDKPEITNCTEFSIIKYLLHVLQTVTSEKYRM